MDEEKVSDPCQVPIKDERTGAIRICGVVKRSLVPHLKAHNNPNMKAKDKWTAKKYRRDFPEFSLGQPNFVHPPEEIAKWLDSRDKYQRDRKEAKKDLENSPEDIAGSQAVKQRFEELWDQVNRDVPARQWALEAARSEERIEEINRRYDLAFKRGDYGKLKTLMDELFAQQKVLEKCMTILDLTVKNRREKNQLGNDTVAQLVSNYAGTLRRMSPEKRETFNNRVKEVRRVMAERIRQKLLAEILDEKIDEFVEVKHMTEQDYDEKIREFIDRAGD